MWLTNAYARKTVVYSTRLENIDKFQRKCSLLFLEKDLHVGVTLNMWETAIYVSRKNGGKILFPILFYFFCLLTHRTKAEERISLICVLNYLA